MFATCPRVAAPAGVPYNFFHSIICRRLIRAARAEFHLPGTVGGLRAKPEMPGFSDPEKWGRSFN